MRKPISTTVNILIVVFVLWAWVSMTFRLGKYGYLSSGGLQELRYFTVLSNLFQGGVSFAYLIGRRPRLLKYASTTAVALTFCIVLFFLGPLYGFETSYVGRNFWFHLVVPLLAIADFTVLDRDGSYNLRDSLFTLIPMVVYGILYAANLALNGIEGNDWYGFASRGPGTAALIFFVILLANWVIALLLRLPRRR